MNIGESINFPNHTFLEKYIAIPNKVDWISINVHDIGDNGEYFIILYNDLALASILYNADVHNESQNQSCTNISALASFAHVDLTRSLI